MFFSTAHYAECPCFDRDYLYSIFYSEQHTFNCSVMANGIDDANNQVVFMESRYVGPGRQPANFGQARSHSDRCELLIDNQATTAEYTRREQKAGCDREIIEACKALKIPPPRWPDDDHRF